jgi:hypothetical protein
VDNLYEGESIRSRSVKHHGRNELRESRYSASSAEVRTRIECRGDFSLASCPPDHDCMVRHRWRTAGMVFQEPATALPKCHRVPRRPHPRSRRAADGGDRRLSGGIARRANAVRRFSPQRSIDDDGHGDSSRREGCLRNLSTNEAVSEAPLLGRHQDLRFDRACNPGGSGIGGCHQAHRVPAHGGAWVPAMLYITQLLGR